MESTVHLHNQNHVTSLKLTHGYNDYVLFMREENGEVLLDVSYESQMDRYRTVSFENAAVSHEDLLVLSALCDAYLLGANLQSNDGKNNSGVTAAVEMTWSSQASYRAVIDTWDINDSDAELLFIAHLFSFFNDLLKRFDQCYVERSAEQEPVAEGSTIFASCRWEGDGTQPESYLLRMDDGEILFDADTTSEVIEDDGSGGGDVVQLRDVLVTKDEIVHFYHLCSIFKLNEMQNIAASGKLYVEPPWNDAVFENMYRKINFRYGGGSGLSLIAVWSNGARLVSDTVPQGLADALRDLFRSMVRRIQAEPVPIEPQGRIVSLRFTQTEVSELMRKGTGRVDSQSASRRRHGSRFFLREVGEEFQLDAWCLFKDITNGNDMDREFGIERGIVTEEDMALLRQLCYKNAFTEKWQTYSEVRLQDDIVLGYRSNDVRRNRLEVVWENEARLDARLYFSRDFIPSFELRSFFAKLAARVDIAPPAEGKIVSFKLKGAYSEQFSTLRRFIPNMRPGSMPQRGGSSRKDADYLLSYEYHLQEVDGAVRLLAHESDHPGLRELRYTRSPHLPGVGTEHLEALRALCAEHDFAGRIQEYHAKRWEEFEHGDMFPTDTGRNPNFDFFEIEWENGAHCEGTQLPRAFQEFFASVVESILPRE